MSYFIHSRDNRSSHYSGILNYKVYMNSRPIDQEFTFKYNYTSIIQTFQLISYDIFLCENPVYILSDAFSIISTRKVCDFEIAQ